MRIALITTPARTRKVNYVLPSGVIALAAHLERAGHEVIVVDNALERMPLQTLASKAAALAPDLIGISGIITAYAHIIDLSREMRKALPSTPLVLGGQVGINNAGNCFTHMPIDFLVHGYGEIALEKIVRHLSGQIRKEQIPGISFRNGNDVITNPGREYYRHIDDRPIPAYHLVDMDHYTNALHGAKSGEFVFNGNRLPLKEPRILPVFGTLGCTDRCAFCVHEQEFVGIKFVSNQVLIDHLKFLNKTYGINIFNMGEEMFISSLKRAQEFNALMKEHLPGCYWMSTTRADSVTPGMIAELKTGNCIGLLWGYESGSQAMLNLMNKRMTVETNNRAYRLARDAGYYSTTTLMIGNAGETNLTVKETIASIHETGMDRGAVFLAAAYPGGRTWDWAVERGIIADTHQYLLSVSDKDAADFTVNLTPYPDFVLKAWQMLVNYALEREARVKNPQHPIIPNFKRGRKNYIRMVLRDIGLKHLLPWMIDAYFVLYGLRSRLYETQRDRRFAVRADAKGALLPDHFIKGAIQRYLSEEELDQLWKSEAPRVHSLSP
ncbi:MAG: B12-binding domain-containing radical SAM protein [Rhodospirillales bacterium]|nr:MAG: B12-binding domain-containing radical SAM protein [Rhodospirillales bacterium]